MITADILFTLENYAHGAVFSKEEPVWSGLRDLKTYMDSHPVAHPVPEHLANGVPLTQPYLVHDNQFRPVGDCEIEYGDTNKGGLVVRENGNVVEGATVIMAGAILMGQYLVFGQGSLVEGGATIKGPAIIGDATEVRQGAYLRGYTLIGDRCVAGHATEIKHSIFLDDAKAGHFAYLGDSILGNHANLGAGTKFANLKFIPGTIKILHDSVTYDTQMRKFGAILGDRAQTGCNSVTNPGTIIGKRGMLMPNTTAPSGYHLYGAIIR